MSLRIRLFLSFGSLLLLLVAAQWWWVRSLADDLSVEIDQVAFSVGRSVASILIEDIEGDSDVLVEHRHLGDCADEPCAPKTVVTTRWPVAMRLATGAGAAQFTMDPRRATISMGRYAPELAITSPPPMLRRAQYTPDRAMFSVQFTGPGA